MKMLWTWNFGTNKIEIVAAETSLGVISEYNLKKQSVHSQASGAVQIALCSQVSITGELSHLG